jgi:hypothetical protein
VPVIELRAVRAGEIPLFAITTYALCKKGVSLHRGDITGICRIAPPL